MMGIVAATVVYGGLLSYPDLRRWDWSNFLYVLPLVPLLLLQRKAGLPQPATAFNSRKVLLLTFCVGMIFGALDVIVIKGILHPEPYTSLPPFLQPFPYSIFLYFSGALEIEVYYRMLPLTIFLLADQAFFKGRYRKPIIIALGCITSLIEPILQFPDGQAWFIVYATLSGIAMNAWQYMSYVRYGFAASLLVRLGHYLLWHISLGVYVQFIELAH